MRFRNSSLRSMPRWIDGSVFGKYSAEKAKALKAQAFDRNTIARRGLKYERLDQLTVEVLLGVR